MAASVGYFIEYIMMHGTINIKETLHVRASKVLMNTLLWISVNMTTLS